MRVLLCKIHCPSFICFCKPSSHIYSPGPLKLENTPHVPSKLVSVPEASDQLPVESTEVNKESLDGKQPIANCLKSSLRKPTSEPGALTEKQKKKSTMVGCCRERTR
ncbi:Nuclear polyadenylated RNA-binding protein [Quillaja saponaria]|uniref:Nuclear polyadenylated RNA-binding protein n=1 Tax=Quillaja saponaria TaxID=32244 RepID=A0AAD7LDJ8_QUISA|nr:Nuclear polyadenylated RNA-binding protein [Quillaja saponaria]